MSNKFTGITSGGDNIPVYDKAAHQALSAKLDASALAPAISGKADTSAIPSLDGYATQQWVGEQGYLTAVPEGYATTEDVISATSGLQPSGDYASASDLANYQPVSAMTAFQAAGDYLSGNALDSLSGTWETVTAKADTTALEAYQTIEGMSAYQEKGDYYSASNPSGFISTVPETYLQNTDLTVVDNKITEISGIALSAGDELPSGTMNTSGLEYNAVNEISGYNGSAIAQYGAEKQWLTHDDTIVHVSNSAQYALGVNLPAISADLARMMGVDETVLFSGSLTGGTAPTAYQLSEPISAFDRYRVYWLWNFGTDNAPKISEYFWDSNRPAKNNFCLSTDERAYGTNYSVLGEFVFASNLIDITYNYSMQGSDTANKYIKIQRIVGIGRKS